MKYVLIASMLMISVHSYADGSKMTLSGNKFYVSEVNENDCKQVKSYVNKIFSADTFVFVKPKNGCALTINNKCVDSCIKSWIKKENNND